MTRRREVFVLAVNRIGDVVLSSIVLEVLWAEQESQATTLFTTPEAVCLFLEDPRVDVVRGVPVGALGWRAAIAGALLQARAREARVLNLDLYPPRSFFVRGLGRVLGLDVQNIDVDGLRSDGRRAAQGRLPHFAHRARYYANVVLPPTAPLPAPRLVVSTASLARVANRVATIPGGPGAVLIVHPGSTDPTRRPPVEAVAAFVRAVLRESVLVPVVVGTAAERACCESLARAVGDPAVSWAGSLPLTDLPALLARATLFVGGDSGPLKIAEAVGCPSISLWGKADAPSFAGPLGPRHRVHRFGDAPETMLTSALELIGNTTGRPKRTC